MMKKLKYSLEFASKIPYSYSYFKNRFAAEELGTEPYIRSLVKKLYMDKGFIKCEPTEKGKKDIDVFNPSYAVKHYRH